MTADKLAGSPKERPAPRHGVEHPAEQFEFARFCLLKHYEHTHKFMDELMEILGEYRRLLLSMAWSRAVSIPVFADYRMAWGLLRFRERAGDPEARSYRKALSSLAERYGLRAPWCAPSLHIALLAAAYTSSGNRVRTLTPFFTRDTERDGEPPAATAVSLPRLLLVPEERRTPDDTVLLKHGPRCVYYDPRTDSWEQRLRETRAFLGRKRLPAPLMKRLLDRRRQIEDTFIRAGYAPRPKPRLLNGEHRLARWTYWTYLAILPPRMTTAQILPPRTTTAQILPIIGKSNREMQHVDQAIKHVLDLLQLPSRRARKTT